MSPYIALIIIGIVIMGLMSGHQDSKLSDEERKELTKDLPSFIDWAKSLIH